ncbi:MAG TPA: PAS domain S-box protein [Methylococcaceae bacterium]|nr:PAS domain S-box protein [Methylococcaceae bacterium]
MTRTPNPSPDRQTEHWNRVLVEAMSEGVGVLDENAVVTYVNPALCGITGYSAGELLGQPVIRFFDEANRALLLRRLEDRTSGKGESYELGFTRKDGRRCILQISPYLLPKDDGRYGGSVAIIADVTDRRQAEAQVRKLSATIEQSPIGVLIADRTGCIEYVNSRLCEQTGYSAEELIGQNPRLLQSGLTAQETYRTMWDSLVNGGDWRGELQDKRKNGELFWAYEIIFGIRDERGEIAHYGALMEDVTQRKQVEERLGETTRQLKILSQQLLDTQEQERKRVASELHDGIGQYLNALKFSLQRERTQSSPAAPGTTQAFPYAELALLLQEAIEEVRRMAADLRPAILDDLGIVATVNWFCRRVQTVYSHIRFETQIDIREGDVPERLKIVIFRVLQEAMTNVAKHAKATAVQVSLARNEKTLSLDIVDNGAGFDVARIMDRKATERGFGLFSMRERVKLSGGDFLVESAPGKGARIAVRWTLSGE